IDERILEAVPAPRHRLGELKAEHQLFGRTTRRSTTSPLSAASAIASTSSTVTPPYETCSGSWSTVAPISQRSRQPLVHARTRADAPRWRSAALSFFASSSLPF